MSVVKEHTSERKHGGQMTKEERETLLNFAKKIPKNEWFFNFYTENRIKERGGNKEFILETLHNGELIEYHLRDNKSRILLRGKYAVSEHHPYVPCVVFEIKTKKVITVYWNHIKDNHRTINMNQYDEELNVIKSFIEND